MVRRYTSEGLPIVDEDTARRFIEQQNDLAGRILDRGSNKELLERFECLLNENPLLAAFIESNYRLRGYDLIIMQCMISVYELLKEQGKMDKEIPH